MNSLEQACSDILHKNMQYTQGQIVYMLYDRDSPLAQLVSDAYRAILPADATIREFVNPPQPLYRGGFINQENPHASNQKRLATSHNIAENARVGFAHHTANGVEITTDTSLDSTDTNADTERIKHELTSLPAGSIVILVQSTNFRLSTFRIRLELFHRGIAVVEHNHLAYIPEEQFDTFIDAIAYRTPEYVRLENEFKKRAKGANKTTIISHGGAQLVFGALEEIRGNTGDYSHVEKKGGTIPLGETFTEAIDLANVNGEVWIDTFPNEDFSIAIVEPFRLVIEHGRVLPSPDFPPDFQKLYDWIVEYEDEVLVRELGFGLNDAISSDRPLRDINFHERKVGVHLSIGKKHGIYGKKLPKNMMQRFHIDIFVALDSVLIADEVVFADGKWIV